MLTPFLVLMGALMICFGDAALWKIRAQATVHYTSTQTESFRAGQHSGFSGLNPRPANWPQPASMGGQGGADLNEVQDLFWNQTGPIDVAALQGDSGSGRNATLTDPFMGNRFTVDRQFMAERGVHQGTAAITKRFPMLTKVLPSDGTFRVDLQSEMLTRDWYYSDMNLGWNSDRRANHLYNQSYADPGNLDPSKNLQLQPLWTDFETAFNNLKSNPNKADLDFLDNDQEWTIYHPGSRPPDFHPPRPTGCVLEMEDYLNFDTGRYRAYLASIRRVPLRMARAWVGTYQAELEARLNIPGYVPKGPLSDSELDARIQNLESYIRLLQAAGYQ